MAGEAMSAFPWSLGRCYGCQLSALPQSYLDHLSGRFGREKWEKLAEFTLPQRIAVSMRKLVIYHGISGSFLEKSLVFGGKIA